LHASELSAYFPNKNRRRLEAHEKMGGFGEALEEINICHFLVKFTIANFKISSYREVPSNTTTMTTLTLTRRGSFIVRMTHDDSTQCGIRGTRKLFYRVEIRCPETALDSQGFMVDQLEIHKMIRARYSWMTKFLSCENLALDCAKVMKGMVKEFLSVKVSIGMSERAFMTCELTSE
jgi:hypothetical protein